MSSTLAWLALIFIAYTYFGFPLWLWMRTRKLSLATDQGKRDHWPSVTIVIAVYNEEETIEKKLLSLAELEYPAEQWRVLLVDDGSTDDTVLRAHRMQMPWLTLLKMPKNAGKASAINYAMSQVDSEICVYMDARQRVSNNTLKALVSHFDNTSVGAVSGELMIVDEESHEQVNMGLYWRYEKSLREMESRLYSTTGATGALYAIRRELFVPLHENAILDDFDTPVNVLKAGKRVVFESSAQAFDSSQVSLKDEFKRKLRTLTGNFQSFSHHKWLFSPYKNPVWWQFLSHKVFRLAVPWALLVLLVASILAGGAWWSFVVIGQLVFYGLAVAARFVGVVAKFKLASFALTFVQLNLAAWLAAFRYYSGDVRSQWKV